MILLGVIGAVVPSWGAKCSHGVRFKESLELEVSPDQDVELSLQGVGLRKVLFFSAFYGAYYTEVFEDRPEEVVDSFGVKAMTVRLLVDVTRSQLVDQWNKEFRRLCGEDCERLRPFHKQFISYARDFSRGEKMTVVFLPNRVDFITYDRSKYKPVLSGDYGRLMLDAAVGPGATNIPFREGALGHRQICRR